MTAIMTAHLPEVQLHLIFTTYRRSLQQQLTVNSPGLIYSSYQTWLVRTDLKIHCCQSQWDFELGISKLLIRIRTYLKTPYVIEYYVIIIKYQSHTDTVHHRSQCHHYMVSKYHTDTVHHISQCHHYKISQYHTDSLHHRSQCHHYKISQYHTDTVHYRSQCHYYKNHRPKLHCCNVNSWTSVQIAAYFWSSSRSFLYIHE